MRLLHRPFDEREIEHYRKLVFSNLTRGMLALLKSMEGMNLKLSDEHQSYIHMIEHAPDLRDGEPFPMSFYDPLQTLWTDRIVQQAWKRGNEAALPEK